MMESGLTLVIRQPDSEAIRLELYKEKQILREEDLSPDARCIDSEKSVEMHLEGLELDEEQCALVNVCLNETVIASASLHKGEAAVIPVWDVRDRRLRESPFNDIIGVAHLSLNLSLAIGQREVYYTDVVPVSIKNGVIGENLLAMSERVSKLARLLFKGDDVLATQRQGQDPLELLNDTVRLYDRHYTWFREQAKTRLTTTMRERSIEKLTQLTPEATRWIATHPGELQPTQQGLGIRAKGKSWMPRHALVKTVAPSRDIIENRQIVAFPMLLATESLRLAARYENLREQTGELTSLKDLRLKALCPAVAKKVEAFRAIATRLKRLSLLYREALGVKAEKLHTLPPVTTLYLQSAPYRMMYDAMRRWFSKSDESDIEVMEKRLASVTGSRLYEYFTLVNLLEGFHQLGFEDTNRSYYAYKELEEGNVNAEVSLVNTFEMKKDGDIVRIWYQPVLISDSDGSENGIGLFRTSGWSPSSRGLIAHHKTEEAWYTPDFVLEFEHEGHSAWAICDSKYTTLRRAQENYVLTQAFKYFTTVAASDGEDVFAGLWLFCGRPEEQEERTKEGSIFDVVEKQGMRSVPDIQVVRLTGLEKNESHMAAVILDAMCSALN